MVIAGFNKLTLLDFPQKMACIIFFAGCNFRCPFCHNSSIASCGQNSGGESVSEEEILAFLKKRHGILEGVVLSGGEPLMNNLDDLTELIEKIRALGYKIKLDTNGSYPQKLKILIEKGLVDYVAMDIKNCPKKYSLSSGAKVNFDDIMNSISLIRNSGIDYEFRTTLVKELHDENDIREIGAWLKNEKNYYIQEFVNSGALFDNSLSPTDTNRAFEILREYIPEVKKR